MYGISKSHKRYFKILREGGRKEERRVVLIEI